MGGEPEGGVGGQGPSERQAHYAVDEACTREELSHEFGQPELLYHNFVKFVTAANLVFCLVSLVAWVPHARATLPRLAAAGLGWRSRGLVLSQYLNVFFLSSFQVSTDAYWICILNPRPWTLVPKPETLKSKT